MGAWGAQPFENDSEAYELWAETEHLDEWLDSIHKINTALKA